MSTEHNIVDKLAAAVECLMDAWIKPENEPPRSMHDLKTDMDYAYKQGRCALDEFLEQWKDIENDIKQNSTDN